MFVEHQTKLPIKSTSSWGCFDPYWCVVPPGRRRRWPWKRGSGRRLLFLFPGPWCGAATSYHSHTFAKIQHSKLPALEDSHYWWLITSNHATIRFINPPPLHELFHHKILMLVPVWMTPRTTYEVYVEDTSNAYQKKVILKNNFSQLWCFREMN